MPMPLGMVRQYRLVRGRLATSVSLFECQCAIACKVRGLANQSARWRAEMRRIIFTCCVAWDPVAACSRRSYRQPDHLGPARCNSDSKTGAVRLTIPPLYWTTRKLLNLPCLGNLLVGDVQYDVVSAVVGRAVVSFWAGSKLKCRSCGHQARICARGHAAFRRHVGLPPSSGLRSRHALGGDGWSLLRAPVHVCC